MSRGLRSVVKLRSTKLWLVTESWYKIALLIHTIRSYPIPDQLTSLLYTLEQRIFHHTGYRQFRWVGFHNWFIENWVWNRWKIYKTELVNSIKKKEIITSLPFQWNLRYFPGNKVENAKCVTTLHIQYFERKM